MNIQKQAIREELNGARDSISNFMRARTHTHGDSNSSQHVKISPKLLKKTEKTLISFDKVILLMKNPENKQKVNSETIKLKKKLQELDREFAAQKGDIQTSTKLREKKMNTRVLEGVSSSHARKQVNKIKSIARKDQEAAADYWKYKFISDGKQQEWARLSNISEMIRTQKDLKKIVSEWDGFLESSISTLREGVNDANIMGVLFWVFKQSIKEANQDKKYWMEKLDQMNKIGATLSDYIKELNNIISENPGGCTEETARYLLLLVKWMDVTLVNNFRKNEIAYERTPNKRFQ